MPFLVPLSVGQTQVVGVVFAVAAVVLSWLGGLAFFAFRIGKFEATVTTKLDTTTEQVNQIRVSAEQGEKGLRQEVKDLRDTLQHRMDDLYKEVVKR